MRISPHINYNENQKNCFLQTKNSLSLKKSIKHSNKELLINSFENITTKYSNLFLQVNTKNLKYLVNKIINSNSPILLGISGINASGKTTFASLILTLLENFYQQEKINKNVVLVNSDNFLKDNSKLVEKYGGFDKFLSNSGYSFNTFSAYDLEELYKVLNKLKNKESVKIPEYKMDGTCRSIPNSIAVNPADIVIVEGVYMLSPQLKNCFDLNLYFEIPKDIQKIRWFNREKSRGNDNVQAKINLFEDIWTKAKEFILPYKKDADFIINGSYSQEDVKNSLQEIMKNFYIDD